MIFTSPRKLPTIPFRFNRKQKPAKGGLFCFCEGQTRMSINKIRSKQKMSTEVLISVLILRSYKSLFIIGQGRSREARRNLKFRWRELPPA